MAKCVITFEDDGDDLKVKVDFEPHQRRLTYAQSIGFTFFKKIQEALEVGDDEVHPLETPPPDDPEI